jgi:recombination protein RecT
LVAINQNITMMIQQKQEALPKDFNQTRFIQNCMTVLMDTKGIEQMDPKSVARTMLKGAFLGLDFFMRECYAIPYGDSLNFQTDYKGEKKLAKKYAINKIRDIYAHVVREDEMFSLEVKDGKRTVDWKQNSFSDLKIVGAFAVVYYEDGNMDVETMSTQEIETIRKNFSKAAQSKAWVHTPEEMYRKTVLRRLLKNVEKDFENQEQAKAFEESADTDMENNVVTDKKEQSKQDTKNKAAELFGSKVDIQTGEILEVKENGA